MSVLFAACVRRAPSTSKRTAANARTATLALAVSLLIGLPACARVDAEREVTRAAQAITPPTEPPRAPETEPAPTPSLGPRVGRLEHPDRLTSLFARLRDLEKERGDDVRILQLGDSHTASDYGTSVARTRLATRFGDGGRGFLPIGSPHKRLFQAGEIVSRGVAFTPREVSLRALEANEAERERDGRYGLGGVAMDTRTSGALLSSRIAASADSYEIAFLARPGGGSFLVHVDGKLKARVSTASAREGAGFHAFEVPRGPHLLEVHAVGDGPLRVYGVRLDDQRVGVTFDALGIHGAKATTTLGWDGAHFTEQLSRARSSLAILAYGTNEAGDATTTSKGHAAAIRGLAARVRESGAACLVLGPPDRGRGEHPKLSALVSAQRAAADEAGCAFFDQRAAMGGTGSIARWSRESPARARRDLVHLTRAGYATLAEALVDDLLSAYDAWRSADDHAASLRAER